jgi:hypothetical protein
MLAFDAVLCSNLQQRLLDTAKAIKKEVTDGSSSHISQAYYHRNAAHFRAAPGLAEQLKESYFRVLALVNAFEEMRNYLQAFVSARFNHHTLYLW